MFVSSTNTLPNLFLVGAAKSGTTALANMLGSSEDICVPDIKEPHFHVSRLLEAKVPFVISESQQYMDLFSQCRGCKYRLDASVLYLPLHEAAIPSIKTMSGNDVKIIILLREPLDRAVSAYKHALRYNENESLGFDDAVREDYARRGGNPMLCYRWLSEYEEQVKAYREAFENVLVLRSESVFRNPQGALDQVSNFLGIPPFRYEKPRDENREAFSWRVVGIGRFLNSCMPGSVRHSLKNKCPICYRVIRWSVLLFFANGKKGNVKCSRSTQEIFQNEKKKIDSYLGKFK